MTRPGPEMWEARKAALADIDRLLADGHIGTGVAERGRQIIDRLFGAWIVAPSIDPESGGGLSFRWAVDDKYVGIFVRVPFGCEWQVRNAGGGEPYAGSANCDLLPVNALRDSIDDISDWMQKPPAGTREVCVLCGRPIRWSVPDTCWNHTGHTPGLPARLGRPSCRSAYGVPRPELVEAMRIFYPDLNDRPWSHYSPDILATLRSDS